MATSSLPRYKTVFASDIRVITPTSDMIKEAHASIDSLRALLPVGVKPEDEPDLLYVAGNLAVGDMINKNDDGITAEEAIKSYRSFEKKLCDVEHKRNHNVGFIYKAGLSDRKTNQLITEDEARKAGVFNISTLAVLWRVADRQLCDIIEENSNNPLSPDKDSLSLSWEVGFDNYDIVELPRNSSLISEAINIVKEDETGAFKIYDAALRANGGAGVRGGKRVARILKDIIPLGQGIVVHPAADVTGLAPITSSAEVTLPTPAIISGVGEAPVAPDVSIVPANNSNSSHSMKIKLTPEVSASLKSQYDSALASLLNYVDVLTHNKAEASEIASVNEAIAALKSYSAWANLSTQVSIAKQIDVKDVKIVSMDYVEVTCDVDLGSNDVTEVKISLPWTEAQLATKKFISSVDVTELNKILSDIVANLWKARELFPTE